MPIRLLRARAIERDTDNGSVSRSFWAPVRWELLSHFTSPRISPWAAVEGH